VPRPSAALLALIGAIAAGAATAEPTPLAGPHPYGSLFRSLAGDGLERDHGIGVLGFGHLTAAWADGDIATTALPQGRGRGVQPQGGMVQDEGLNLNQLGLMVCKGDGCPPNRLFTPGRNVLSRVGPLPGPRGEEVIVDWNLTVVYGEDAVFWRTRGLDDWRFDIGERNKLAFTQWFLDIYLPVGAGASLIIGNFQTPLAAEIGYAFVPPNGFSSRTYAFMAAPAKHLGAIGQFKLPLAESAGIASLSLGLVSNWNGADFGSGSHLPGVFATASWRSPDLATWLDLEFTWSNGEDDFGDVARHDGKRRPRGGGSQYLALSSSDEVLDRVIAFLTLRHQLGARLESVSEAVWGHQQGGDRAPLPFAIVRDSAFYGANTALRYALRSNIHLAGRFEWFRDEHAANVLWSGVGAGGGNVFAGTLSLGWQALPNLLLRPEIKYDRYDGEGHLFAADGSGLASADDQWLGVLNLEIAY